MFAEAIAGDTKFANPILMALVTLMQASLHVIDCSLGESTDPFGLSCATFAKSALVQFLEKSCLVGDLSDQTCDNDHLSNAAFQFKLLTDMVTGVAIGGVGVALCLAPGSYALAWNTAARSPSEPAITLALQCPASPASLQLGPVLAIEDRFARSAQLSSPCTVAVRVMSVSGTSGERRLENVVLGRSG